MGRGVRSFDGARLRELRIAKGLSQRALAARSRVPHPSISAFERGRRFPEPATLVAVAAALGISPADLLRTAVGDIPLVDRRAALGMTQQELASVLGLATSTYAAIERGALPLPAHVARHLEKLAAGSHDASAGELHAGLL